MQPFALFFCFTLFLVSCTSNDKTIIVMSKGTPTIDLNSGTIHAENGNGHEEKTMHINQKIVSFKLNSPAGNASVNLQENGLYIINLKNDTIIGAYQQYSSIGTEKNRLSQDYLKQKIDSLQNLTTGENISTANRNYFILPNQSTFITTNKNAIVVAPYHQMRSAERVDGKDPEIYRFYSIKEIRIMIAKLQALTVAPK